MLKLSEKKLKKILTATLATAVIGYFNDPVLAADVLIDDKLKTSADDWKNSAGDVVVHGGGGETSSSDVSDKKVAINGGTFTGIFGGMTSSGNANNNTVIFNGGDVGGGIVGGFTFYYDGLHAGNVWGNKVYMNGGTVNWLTGGEVGYFSSVTDFSNLTGGNVYDNTVEVNGGTVTGGIIGGSALTGNAINNTININGGTVSGKVIGGEVKKPTGTSQASNNTININGSPNLSGATFYGGLLGTDNYSAGNTLNINTAGITVKDIQFGSFSNINFNIPYYVQNGETILSMTNQSGLTSDNTSKFGVSLNGNSQLEKGDIVHLIVNGSSSYEGDRAVTVGKGLLYNYNGNISQTASGFDLELTSDAMQNTENRLANEESRFPILPPPEIDIFTDAMTSSMFNEEDVTVEPDINVLGGYSIFINSGGGRIKTKTGGGNYVRMSKGNYDLGFARSLESQTGRLYIAPVFERVVGHYTAKLPSNSFGEVAGNGSSKYMGGGFIARKVNANGYYIEGSFRAGKIENDFASNDFVRGDSKVRATYTMKSPAFTGHLRIGNAKRLNKNNLLDVYGIYFYTRQNGDNVTLYADGQDDANVNFSSVQNHTLRLGYRLTTRTSKISRIYTGLAYQYDRGSDSTVVDHKGFSDTADGVRGSSGMFELGWQIKPNKNNAWLLDVNATGWLGHHQGFNVLAKMQKSF